MDGDRGQSGWIRAGAVIAALFAFSVLLREQVLGRPTALASVAGYNDALWDLAGGDPRLQRPAEGGQLEDDPRLLARIAQYGKPRDGAGKVVFDGWAADYLSAYHRAIALLHDDRP